MRWMRRGATSSSRRALSAVARNWSPQAFTGGGSLTANGRRRNAFYMQFDTTELAEYLDDHANGVWPEMQTALVDAGWHNYSLFYRPDGFAVGYFESDTDFTTACARMDATDINTKWQAAMSKFTPAGVSPIDASGEFTHYFYLGVDVAGSESESTIDDASSPSWAPQASTGGGGLTASGRRRIAFYMQFNTTELAEYLDDHATGVWPEMQTALVDAGWHNYSLFYRPDGFAMGYFESDVDFDTACARMDASPINAKWQAAMSKHTPSGESPIDASGEFTHYFYLGTDLLAEEEDG